MYFVLEASSSRNCGAMQISSALGNFSCCGWTAGDRINLWHLYGCTFYRRTPRMVEGTRTERWVIFAFLSMYLFLFVESPNETITRQEYFAFSRLGVSDIIEEIRDKSDIFVFHTSFRISFRLIFLINCIWIIIVSVSRTVFLLMTIVFSRNLMWFDRTGCFSLTNMLDEILLF